MKHLPWEIDWANSEGKTVIVTLDSLEQVEALCLDVHTGEPPAMLVKLPTGKEWVHPRYVSPKGGHR